VAIASELVVIGHRPPLPLKKGGTNMNAFLTGSQVYGTPTEKSDIDLVVLLSDDDRLMLAELVAEQVSEKTYGNYGVGSLSLRFGNLNLIVAKDSDEFTNWAYGTKVLRRQSPVSRERAVELFKNLKGRVS
jgi:hypothetical protein